MQNLQEIKNRKKTHKIDLKSKRKNRRIWENKKLATDPNYKLSKSMRRRLHHALKGRKSYSTEVLLGCKIAELKTHLEKQFKPGMTWENYGKWHIDHIFPISKVDLQDTDQLLKVMKYTNLQPLWAKDNIIKGNKSV